MKNTLKTQHELNNSKQCPLCRKTHNEPRLFCSNKCYIQADKATSKESTILKRIERNIEKGFALCEMQRALLVEQLEAENYPVLNYHELKQDEKEFEATWYPTKMV
jgi:predicted nucleic acid-binding Zn ribbon protein